MDKPDSGAWPLLDLQEPQTHLYPLECDQRVAAAPVSHTTTAIVPRSP